MQIINTGKNIYSYCRNVTPDFEEKVSRIELGVFLLDPNDIEKHTKIIEMSATADLNYLDLSIFS